MVMSNAARPAARPLTAGEQRTIVELGRNAERLGDLPLAAACARALSGSARDVELALDFARELEA
jgi:hypothetical protein